MNLTSSCGHFCFQSCSLGWVRFELFRKRVDATCHRGLVVFHGREYVALELSKIGRWYKCEVSHDVIMISVWHEGREGRGYEWGCKFLGTKHTPSTPALVGAYPATASTGIFDN
eukprot:2750804-Rhodomonas_salina.2